MTKRELREKVWELLRRCCVIRFPGTQSRIPNFVDADRAARLLSELAVWRRAVAIKVSADAPQLLVRRLAIEDGKLLYMAVPQLRAEKCFVEIDPRRMGTWSHLATNVHAACKYGRLVAPRDVRPIDLVVCGSVAVSRNGTRVGKGGGYTDLEYGMLREEGKVRESTPIATTVHALQITNERVTMGPHDVPVDFLVTPAEVIAARPNHARPRGIYWDLLRPKMVNTIPVLRRRRHQIARARDLSPHRV